MAYSYPKLPSKPTRAHYQRLLWRAGYAGSQAQITHYVNKGLDGAIFELLTPYRRNGAGGAGAPRRRQQAGSAQPLGP